MGQDTNLVPKKAKVIHGISSEKCQKECEAEADAWRSHGSFWTYFGPLPTFQAGANQQKLSE